jgi:hypothetical protein
MSHFQETCCSSISYDQQRKPKGFTLIEILVILWVLIFAVSGLANGSRFGSQYGPGWSVLGAVIGFFTGILVAVALLLLFGLIVEMVGRFCKWWRLFPPVCENGTCRPSYYESTETPLLLRKHVDGIQYHAYRCKCGNLYTKIGCLSLKTQWVRILSDNAIQPYLKHFPFGRWKPDTSDRIEIPISNDDRTWDLELHTTSNLTPTQLAVFLLFLLPPILFIVLRVFLPLLIGKELALASTTNFVMLFLVGPLGMAAGFCFVSCQSGRHTARSIEANSDCIRIQRFNKQHIEIQWSQIISVKYKRFDNCWVFRTLERKILLRSDDFLKKDWQLVLDYIKQHISEKCQSKRASSQLPPIFL